MSKYDLEEAVKSIQRLPTLPSVLGQILDAASDPEASALDLGQYIATDQSLAGSVLKIVNSAYYSFQREITSIARAIVILGFIEVRNLALTATAFQSLAKGNSGYDRTQLWRHSMGTAIAASRLARTVNVEEPDDFFTAGLLHDIGKVTLDVLYPEQFIEAAQNANANGRFLRDVELETFGFSHPQVGGLLGKHWNLPKSVVDTIEHHHCPEASSVARELTDITALANYLTYQAGLGEASNGKQPEFPEAVAKRLRASDPICENIAEDLRESRERIDQLIDPLSKLK